MNPEAVLSRLRQFLLVFSALLFVGAVIELWLIGHNEEFVQLIPFGLCGLALAAVLLVLFLPRRALILGLLVCMGLVMLGSLFGVYEHVTGNAEFEREINPNASTGNVIMGALGGANPLLAPGVLGVAAMLSLAAIYHHPALERGHERQS